VKAELWCNGVRQCTELSDIYEIYPFPNMSALRLVEDPGGGVGGLQVKVSEFGIFHESLSPRHRNIKLSKRREYGNNGYQFVPKRIISCLPTDRSLSCLQTSHDSKAYHWSDCVTDCQELCDCHLHRFWCASDIRESDQNHSWRACGHQHHRKP
jgi:hypothetical protein